MHYSIGWWIIPSVDRISLFMLVSGVGSCTDILLVYSPLISQFWAK